MHQEEQKEEPHILENRCDFIEEEIEDDQMENPSSTTVSNKQSKKKSEANSDNDEAEMRG